MPKKVKFDFQINQNIYYRAGIFFVIISLLINLLIRFKIAPIDWQQLRLFPISVGIPFYFYGVYAHFKKNKRYKFYQTNIWRIIYWISYNYNNSFYCLNPFRVY